MELVNPHVLKPKGGAEVRMKTVHGLNNMEFP